MQTVFKVLLVIGSVFILNTKVVAEQVIYQWRDSNNVLHVSQLPPANVEYQTVVLGTKSAPPPAAVIPDELAKKSSAELLQSCTKAQGNLRILEQDLPIYIDMGDGTKELLDDSRRDQQKQLAEKQIQFYCSEQAPPKTIPRT